MTEQGRKDCVADATMAMFLHPPATKTTYTEKNYTQHGTFI